MSRGAGRKGSFMRNTIVLLVPLCGLVLSACDAGGASGTHHGSTGGAGGLGAGGSLFATGAGGGIIDPGPVCDPCTDFSAAPIFDTLGAPPPGNAPALFDASPAYAFWTSAGCAALGAGVLAVTAKRPPTAGRAA